MNNKKHISIDQSAYNILIDEITKLKEHNKNHGISGEVTFSHAVRSIKHDKY